MRHETQRHTASRLPITATLALTLVACGSPPEINEIPAGALIVDVRTPREFAGDHYPGAVNIPVGQLADRLDELPGTDQTIVVYCRSGNRSRDAKAILQSRGFANVLNGGGLADLRALPRADAQRSNTSNH